MFLIKTTSKCIWLYWNTAEKIKARVKEQSDFKSTIQDNWTDLLKSIIVLMYDPACAKFKYALLTKMIH